MQPNAPAPITSLRNPRVVDYRKLAQKKHRRELARFAVEGVEVLALAERAGFRPRELFVTPSLQGDAARTLAERWQRAGVETLEVDAIVMAAMAERDPPEGILATFAPIVRELKEEDARGLDRLVLILDRLQDPGNLGTLIRTADAVGAAAVFLLAPTVDACDPRAVRGSMGSIFHLPIYEVSERGVLIELLARSGLRVVGADARRGEPWRPGRWKGERIALLLGNESQGIDPAWAEQVAEWARLPIAGRAESLNVAVAGSVLMYFWREDNS